MAKRKKKLWTKTIEGSGIKIRIFEREIGGVIYRDIPLERTTSRNGRARTQHDVKSLRTRDRGVAEQRAREIATEMARLRLNGETPTEAITMGRLAELYLHHRGPMLKPPRLKHMRLVLALLRRHLGDGFRVADFGQHDADAYVRHAHPGDSSPTIGGQPRIQPLAPCETSYSRSL